MNELDKMAPEADAMTPSAATCDAVTEKMCAETESPAENIAAAADAAEKSEKEAVCQETESPAETIAAAADAEMSESEIQTRRFHEMTKEELIAHLKAILEENNMEAHKEVAALKQAFYNIRNKETLDELNAFVEEGNDPAVFSANPDEAENEFKMLFAQFKERRADYIAADEAMRKENLEKKQEIISKLNEIASDIDNVNVKFPEFQQLQQDFKAIKEIPAGAENDIWKQFQTVTEQFYDHLKMNKELRDLDFKKNLEAKKSLIEEAKSLENMNDPVAAFRRLQTLHDEWRELGPVAKEIRESIWEEFREASTVVNRRHQEYFEQRKASELANEEAKTGICEEIEAIDFSKFTKFSEWNEATNKVIELQKKWKEYGFASRKSNNALYARFREACDKFFNAKAEYFQQTKDEFAANLEKKTALCEKAEALKDSDDLKKATDEIVKLQAEWKNIGTVPRKQSDAIWQRFQTACNYFFDERKKLNSARRKDENTNLDAKRKVIEELKALPLDGDRRETIAKVKDLQAKWQEIGFVPFKMKDKLYAEYREVCDALYGAYANRENRARMSKFNSRVSEMKDDSQKMNREREKLVHAYESRKSELQTIENNMGFFNVKSNAGTSIVKEMERKIKRLKEDMAQIEEKIAILDEGEKA